MRKISVCIITKNESEKLKKCLKQLMGYGFEIVVVDTGSTDDTVVMAKNMQIKYVISVGAMISPQHGIMH